MKNPKAETMTQIADTSQALAERYFGMAKPAIEMRNQEIFGAAGRGRRRGSRPRDLRGRAAHDRDLGDVLGVRGIRLADRFLEVGGHSLLAVELLIATEDTFGISLPIVANMENPTAGELAAALATRGRPVAGDGPPATATG